MKKSWFLRGGMVLMFSLLLWLVPETARADLIWEPDDDFYRKHYAECEHVGREFTANGENGRVIFYETPNSDKVIMECTNGSNFFVSFTYQDKKGSSWGVVKIDEKTGWTPMNQLVVVYDNISFCAEHEGEFKEYNGEFTDYKTEASVLFWSYPGSGVINFKQNKIEKDISFSYTYTDEDGQLWGYVQYYLVAKGWICISDSMNENIPSIGAKTIATIIPPNTDTSSERLSTSDHSTLVVIAILVAAVIVFTMIIIRVFYKKNPSMKN